jgi:hypothetical protein
MAGGRDIGTRGYLSASPNRSERTVGLAPPGYPPASLPGLLQFAGH